MTTNLGKLTRVDLREYWEDEARDFTPWLAQDDNLRLLGESIGLDLELAGMETRVGVFKADIVAKEAGTESRVIIENQLERTNHDHLGKLLTYASGLGAKALVWVASEITDEHRKALDWLNEITGDEFGFFGLEMELWRIGDSAPAPKFNLVCRPNEWAKTFTGPDEATEPTETKLAQLASWQGLVDYSRAKGTILTLRKPRPQHWYTLALGRTRFAISLTANTNRKRIGCELYISHRQSKQAFALLAVEKDLIQGELGSTLEWQELPRKKACRIIESRSGDIELRDQWPELHAWLLQRAEAFYNVFSKKVRDLDLDDDEGDGAEAEVV